jgi:S-(hydroxymethyl)glutathione dehydrogenase/alcohol dehydrogenase
MKFNGLILVNTNHDLVWDDIVMEKSLKSGQVLVKIHYSGICGKQVEEFTGKMGKDQYLPHLLGHEGAGEVLEIGNGVTNVKVGDFVVLHWMKSKYGIESELPQYKWRNEKLNAGKITTFNEYAVISSNRMTAISKSTDLKNASLLGCGLSTGLGVVFNESDTKFFHKTAIVGCGGVGLSIIKGLKFLNVCQILATDINEKNLNKAVNFGASESYNSLFELPEKFKGKFDKVFVTATSETALKIANDLASNSSEIYIVGVPAPNAKIEVNALDIHRGKVFKGSYGGSIQPEIDIIRYLELEERNLITYNDLIINIIKPQEVTNTLLKMKKGELSNGRNLISFI